MFEVYDEKQQKQINSLISNECANCKDGNCISLDMPCPQMTSLHLYCKYFVQSVLPSDKQLYFDICHVKQKGKVFARNCARCGKRIYPKSNRQKYCDYCAKVAVKDYDKSRKQKLT